MQSRVAHPYELSPRGRGMITALIAAEWATRPANHRGYWHFAKWLGRGVPREVAVVSVGGGRIEFAMSDPYWARLIASGYEYEPEVAWVLSAVLNDGSDFIDVGANIGYWSVWVSQRLPQSRVLAVEPNPAIFGRLEADNALNGNRFEVLRSAVALGGTGVAFQVPKGRGGHAAASVLADGQSAGESDVVVVEARTLDVILAGFRKDDRDALVKLDIEGLEAPVLESSEAIQDPSVAVLYEDHGADPDCRPTAYLLNRDERCTYFLRPDGGLEQVYSVAQLAELKQRPVVGYNCISVLRGSGWHDRLRAVAMD